MHHKFVLHANSKQIFSTRKNWQNNVCNMYMIYECGFFRKMLCFLFVKLCNL